MQEDIQLPLPMTDPKTVIAMYRDNMHRSSWQGRETELGSFSSRFCSAGDLGIQSGGGRLCFHLMVDGVRVCMRRAKYREVSELHTSKVMMLNVLKMIAPALWKMAGLCILSLLPAEPGKWPWGAGPAAAAHTSVSPPAFPHTPQASAGPALCQTSCSGSFPPHFVPPLLASPSSSKKPDLGDSDITLACISIQAYQRQTGQ